MNQGVQMFEEHEWPTIVTSMFNVARLSLSGRARTEGSAVCSASLPQDSRRAGLIPAADASREKKGENEEKKWLAVARCWVY